MQASSPAIPLHFIHLWKQTCAFNTRALGGQGRKALHHIAGLGWVGTNPLHWWVFQKQADQL